MIFGTVLVLLWIQTIIEDTARIWLGQRAGNILEPVFILNFLFCHCNFVYAGRLDHDRVKTLDDRK